MQLVDTGPGDYLFDLWNFLDVMGVLVFIVYLFWRQQDIPTTAIVRD